MAILICVGKGEAEKKSFNWFIDGWKNKLLSMDSALDVRIFPDYGNPDEIDTILIWSFLIQELARFKNLKCILALSAGVDHLLMQDTSCVRNVPIARLKDPFMKNDIVQYAVVSVLNYVKLMDRWRNRQKEKKWDKTPPFNLSDKKVAVMGLGYLGESVAVALQQLGLKVIGWSNSKKNIPDVTDYVGEAQFDQFLSKADILVCMLPLTPETENIINKRTIHKMPKGAYIINFARGQHIVDEDLLAALASGHLSGVTLDVFRKEPLPPEHPFWKHPKIRVTPHIASVTNIETAAPQIFENYQRALAGKSLLNEVSLKKGY